MKVAATILTILTLVACSSDRTKGLPTSPSPLAQPGPVPPTPSTGGIWGIVLEERSAACIVGATVEVIRGVRQGEIQVQETPCGYWDYGGGFLFDNLPLNTQLTLRASAPGYASKEFTATAVSSGPYVSVSLSRLP